MQGGPVCTTGKAIRPAFIAALQISLQDGLDKDGNMKKASDNVKKAIEKWRKKARERSGGFRLLPREILASEAFSCLSGAAIRLLLLAWDQVYFEKKGKGERKGKRKDGKIYLPHYAAMAIGVKSSQTITKARNELVEMGFLDVCITGSVNLASAFTISERWKKYPYGHQRKDSRPAGRNIFPKTSLSNPNHPINLKRNVRQPRRLRTIPSVQFSNGESQKSNDRLL